MKKIIETQMSGLLIAAELSIDSEGYVTWHTEIAACDIDTNEPKKLAPNQIEHAEDCLIEAYEEEQKDIADLDEDYLTLERD